MLEERVTQVLVIGCCVRRRVEGYCFYFPVGVFEVPSSELWCMGVVKGTDRVARSPNIFAR